VKPRELFIIGPPRRGTTMMAHLLGGAEGVLSLSEPFLQYAVAPHWMLNRFYYQFQKSAGLRPPRAGNNARLGLYLRKMARMNGFRFLLIKETFHDGHAGPPGETPNCSHISPPPGRPWWLSSATRTTPPPRWSSSAAGWSAFPDTCCASAGPCSNTIAAAPKSLPGPPETGRPIATGPGETTSRSSATKTERHLRRVCRRCDLTFHARMLDPRGRRPAFGGGIGDLGVLKRGARPINVRSIGRGRELTAELRRIVGDTCAAHAAGFEYTL
jgi:hypothetical protein